MKQYRLYPSFKHWEDFDRIFIYSDPHFLGDGSNNDAVETNRVFKYEADETQINNINSKVFKNDLLIILGDIGDTQSLQKIKCRNRILITGNHDRGNEYYKPYFSEIYNGPLFICNKILLSHEPIIGEHWLNIHGHIHDKANLIPGNNSICVAANLHNWQPMCLNDLFSHKGEFVEGPNLAAIEDIHRSTINAATKRAVDRGFSYR